jgi:transposase
MTSTSSHQAMQEELRGQRRRKWPLDVKKAMVRESFEPGRNVSAVALRYGVHPNQLSRWRRLYEEGALTQAGRDKAVVPAAELTYAIREIRTLQSVLRKKNEENARLRKILEMLCSR